MVVILIIVILAALIFPVAGNIREKAGRVVCLSNLKQIHHATMLYVAENRGWTPVSNFGGNWTNGWRTSILPYHGNWKIYLCPRAPAAAKNCYSRGNYGINAYIDEIGGQINLIARIQRPCDTIFYGENGDGDWVCEPMNGPWPNPGWIYPVHGNGASVVFVDGHAQWLSITAAHSNNFYLFLVTKP